MKKDENTESNKEKNKVQVWIKKDTIKYNKELVKLQTELLKYQNHVKEKGLKVLMIFEGRDAAGKGGTIKRIIEHLNPRGARIVALEKPNDKEKTQWYFQRYINHLPSAGEIVLFDRSWYNRAGVEPVMEFCTPEEHREFLREVPHFEKMLVKSDIIMFKFYFSVSKKEQNKRFTSRKKDILKQYKLSPVDEESQKLWDKYTVAEFSMLMASDASSCKWTIIRSNNKKKARINCIKHILNIVDYPDKISEKKIQEDKDIVISGSQELELMEKENTFSRSSLNTME